MTINYSSTGSTSATSCNSYTWEANSNTTYTTSGAYSQTYENAVGCDSIHTLHLTINYSSTGSTTETDCNTFTWTGSTYTTSGMYTKTFMNVANCDSVHTMNLTIRYSNSASTTETDCNTFTWTGTTYTTTGSYTKTFTNVANCDSVHTMNLTIRYSNTGSTSVTSCDTYTWTANSSATYTTSGVYVQTFTNAANCDSIHTLNLTVNYRTDSTINQADCESFTWSLGTGTTYTISGTYVHNYTNSVGCASTKTLILNMHVQVSVKAFLAGPYDVSTGLMHDSLRVNSLIPTSNPYTSPTYAATGDPGTDTVSQAILAVTGNNAIVDWVLLELRSAANSTTVLANKRALIQRDGDVVSATDGVSPVAFNTMLPASYFVTIKHRNHMGIMSSTSTRLNGCATNLDLTVSTGVWAKSGIVNAARKQVTGTNPAYVLWSGDANSNKNVKYNGNVANDKDAILTALGGTANSNNTLNAYRKEDLNMDGKVRYNNTDNDRAIILNNVGASTPNNILSQHTPN